ncbi:MAG TPA: metalloregulator ArsR/SmtB family transcription factor [Acetobacteraceae bacterium]
MGNGAGDRILGLLKRRGPQRSADIAAALGTTGEAVRQQLAKLAEEKLVAAAAEQGGVGRPARVWHLTPAAHSRFPDTHAELTVRLIEAVRTTLGEAALERLVCAREQETRRAYHAALAGLATLRARVARLAQLRSREGYMAEWRADADGLLLIENHCPICAAATACQGFCRAELQVFRDVLGPGASVERCEHVLAGARRCAYRIRVDHAAKEKGDGLDRHDRSGRAGGEGQGGRAPRRTPDPAGAQRSRRVRLHKPLPA